MFGDIVFGDIRLQQHTLSPRPPPFTEVRATQSPIHALQCQSGDVGCKALSFLAHAIFGRLLPKMTALELPFMVRAWRFSSHCSWSAKFKLYKNDKISALTSGKSVHVKQFLWASMLGVAPGRCGIKGSVPPLTFQQIPIIFFL